MAGSAMYGLLLGAGFYVLTQAAPQPAGALTWWALLAAQLSWGTSVTWRRTRLPFATAAMALGAVGAALMVCATAVGYELTSLPLAWAGPVYGLMVSGALCLLTESRAHPDDWQRWAGYMEHANALDILLGRHIPDLRNSGRT